MLVRTATGFAVTALILIGLFIGGAGSHVVVITGQVGFGGTGTTTRYADPVPVRYELHVSWAPRGRTLTGSESIYVRNEGDSSLTTIWLRLWANDSIPGQADGCTHRRISIGHVVGSVIGHYLVACSAVSLRLVRPLARGQSVRLRLRFRAQAPTYNDLFGRSLGINLFGNVIPVLAVRDNKGWHLNPDSQVGDPAFTLTAAWHASIMAPSRFTIASTGTEVSNRVVAGRRTVVSQTPHARDFEFAIGLMSRRTATVNGVHIRVFSSSATTASDSRHALQVAARALRTYEAWYGAYGSPEFDVVIANLPYGGIEYPEIVFSTPDTATVAHEVAHQWFYGIVGDDQYNQPWLDESFASWNEEQFVPGTYPCDTNDPLRRHRGQLGLGLSYFENHPNAYVNVVYRGGSCALTALKNMLGRRTFLGMLRKEVSRYHYGIVRTPNFLSLLRSTSPTVARRWQHLVGL